MSASAALLRPLFIFFCGYLHRDKRPTSRPAHIELNYTVSQKVPPLTYYTLDMHDSITIIFGRSVTEKVRNQNFVFPPHLFSASALPCEIGNP